MEEGTEGTIPTLHGAFLSQDQEGAQSLEKVTLFVSFFSMAAWTDLMMSWVCSMLMFQVAWIRVWERPAGHQSEEGHACADSLADGSGPGRAMIGVGGPYHVVKALVHRMVSGVD